MLALAVASALVPLFAAAPASAAVAAPVSGIELTWRLSENAFSVSGSLTENKGADAPATLTGDAWVFTSGSGTYDPYTGETHITFDGALFVGNTGFGNFGEKLGAPSIDVDADGNGSLSADVSIRGPGSAEWQAVIARVVVARFDVPDDQVTVVDGHVSWASTPFFAVDPDIGEGRRQFEPTFVDILPAAFQASFRESTGQGGNQPAKTPSPVSVEFDVAAPTLSAIRTSGLTSGQAITVNGAGFRPDINLFVVNCDSNFDAGARCDFGHFGQAHTDDSGNFSIQLTVVATFGTAPNATDCFSAATACAIQTSWTENPQDRSQEATLPISFSASPPTPPPTPPPGPPGPPAPDAPSAATAVPVGTLAFTGDATPAIAVTGVVLVIAGGLCLRASRRRTIVQG